MKIDRETNDGTIYIVRNSNTQNEGEKMDSTELKRIRNKRTGKTRRIWGWVLVVIGLGSLLPLIAGIFLLVSTNKKVKLWDQYEALINPRGNTSLDFIAQSVEKSMYEIIGDLEEMIENKFFAGPQGDIEAIIDTHRNMLVMCRDGKQMQPFYDREKRKPDYDMNSYDAVYAETREVKKPEYTSAEKINEAINKVDDEDVRLTLERLSASISRIEGRIAEDPDLEKMDNIKKLKSFYLPQTLELIDKLINRRGAPEVLDKIKDTLKMSANAFETIEANIIEFGDIDTMGDIAVLQNMFAREGLLDSDFKVQ